MLSNLTSIIDILPVVCERRLESYSCEYSVGNTDARFIRYDAILEIPSSLYSIRLSISYCHVHTYSIRLEDLRCRQKDPLYCSVALAGVASWSASSVPALTFCGFAAMRWIHFSRTSCGRLAQTASGSHIYFNAMLMQNIGHQTVHTWT